MSHVVMLVGPDFEDSEYAVPRKRLEDAGHRITVLGREGDDAIEGKRGDEKATIDGAANGQDPRSFDALVIPGGYGPDALRIDEDVVGFVKRFCETGRPVAAVCHGPQLLIEADAVRGRRMTSWPSVRTDLINAGAIWVDQEVVEDGPLITSRKPDDLEAFSDAVLRRLSN